MKKKFNLYMILQLLVIIVAGIYYLKVNYEGTYVNLMYVVGIITGSLIVITITIILHMDAKKEKLKYKIRHGISDENKKYFKKFHAKKKSEELKT